MSTVDHDYSVPLAGTCFHCDSPTVAGSEVDDHGSVYWWCIRHEDEVLDALQETEEITADLGTLLAIEEGLLSFD